MKQYNNDYRLLVDDMLSETGEVTVKLSGLHAHRAKAFYDGLTGEAKAAWDAMTPLEQDAVLMEAYKVGQEIVEAGAAEQGEDYRPTYGGGGNAGGDDHLANADELEEAFEESKDDEPVGHCFPAGTPVLLAGGGEAAVEAVAVGDLVLAFDASQDGGRGALVPRRVVRTFVKRGQQLIAVNGVRVTPGHAMLTAGGAWTLAGDLKPGDALVGADGEAVPVTTIKPVEGLHAVYNFEVEGLHTYVAAGLRVHNDSQAVIDAAGTVGQTLGSSLGNLLAKDESTFVRILSSTVVGTATRNLAEAIADNLLHDPLDGELLLGEFDDVDVRSAAVGTATALATAELFEALNFEGFAAATLADLAEAEARAEGLTQELAQELAKVLARLERLTLRAPVAGTVQELALGRWAGWSRRRSR